MRTIRLLVVFGLTAVLVVGMLGPASARRLADAPAGGVPFVVALDGEQEVGPGDPDATGLSTVTINPGRGLACYELEHDLSPDPFGWHIHVGPAGVDGPIVVNFFTQPGAVVPDSGCVDIDRDLALDIIRNPEGYYLNLHNEPFPAGAIRGQLSRTSR
jgi:hypothetical protein